MTNLIDPPGPSCITCLIISHVEHHFNQFQDLASYVGASVSPCVIYIPFPLIVSVSLCHLDTIPFYFSRFLFCTITTSLPCVCLMMHGDNILTPDLVNV